MWDFYQTSFLSTSNGHSGGPLGRDHNDLSKLSHLFRFRPAAPENLLRSRRNPSEISIGPPSGRPLGIRKSFFLVMLRVDSRENIQRPVSSISKRTGKQPPFELAYFPIFPNTKTSTRRPFVYDETDYIGGTQCELFPSRPFEHPAQNSSQGVTVCESTSGRCRHLTNRSLDQPSSHRLHDPSRCLSAGVNS